MDWVKEFSKLLTWKKKDIYNWLPRVQPSNLYLLLLSSAHFLEVVATSGSTFIEEGFSAGSSMILEVETSINRSENFFSKHFL